MSKAQLFMLLDATWRQTTEVNEQEEVAELGADTERISSLREACICSRQVISQMKINHG